MILPITHSLSSICGPQTAESAGKKIELKMIRMILSCKEAAARTVGCMQRKLYICSWMLCKSCTGPLTVSLTVTQLSQCRLQAVTDGGSLVVS